MSDHLRVSTSRAQILKIAMPISLALFVPQINFIVNNIFLGHYSEAALATASITGVYYLIFAGIGFGLNNGLQALISRRAGEQRPDAIGMVFNQGILLALAIAVTGIVITYLAAPFIFHTWIQNESIAQEASAFLRIRILGLPFLYIYQMRNALLVGINRSQLLVVGTLAETLANIFFDYVLIFGKWGFPAMGFNGAAVASVIAEFLGMLSIFLVIWMKGISKRFALFSDFRVNLPVLKSILSMSLPLMFQHAISIISWFFFYLLVEHHGQTALAVSNTMRNIFGFFGVFVWAFAATTNSMVSNIIGQGRKEEVVPLINRIMKMSCSLALVACILLNLFPSTILSIYGQQQSFLDEAIPVARVVSFAMILMSIGLIWLYAVTATGNSRYTLAIELVSIVLYCIYVYLVLEAWRWSIVWGWMSEFVYWTATFTLAWLYIKKGNWRKKII